MNKKNSHDPGYDRENTWGDLYKKHEEQKSGETDFRGFEELFKERGFKDYDKGKEFGDPDKPVSKKEQRFSYPEKPEASLDLHGSTTDEAKAKVNEFMRQSREMRLRKVKIITGIGRGNEDMKSKLRPVVVERLNFYEHEGLIRRYESAPPSDGGYGAIYVYFK